jgi:hypothetical protein
MEGRIFDAGELGIAGDVAGDADVEQIAETLIEDDLRRDAGVGAAQDGRVGMLIQREFALAGSGLVWVLILFRDVMCVAGLQLAQHRRSGRHSVLGSGDRAAQGSAHKRSQDRGSHRLPPWHNFQGSKYRTLKCIMWTQASAWGARGCKEHCASHV